MMKKSLLFTMLLLLITLSGWSQSSEIYEIIPDPHQLDNPTIIFTIKNSDVRNLRLEYTQGELFKNLYSESEKEIKLLNKVISKQETIIENQAIGLKAGSSALQEYKEINEKYLKDKDKYKRRAKLWPYWLGGGFIGGITTCLLIK